MFKDLDFKNRYGQWALISGAAEGIGAAYSDRVGSMGMSLILLDNNEEALRRTEKSLTNKYPNIEIRACVVDLANNGELNAVIDSFSDLEIGLLIANAGIGAVGRWLEIPLETKLTQIAVNCVSTLTLAHKLSPAMVKRRRGGIIIMASGSAEMGSSFITTYAATKAFDRVFAEGLWAELSPYGVDVTTVMPGAVNTPGFRNTLPVGKEPTKLMQPVDPHLVVDAALEGLGKEINIKPSSSRGYGSFAMKFMLLFLPRKRFLELGNKAVKEMYDR